MNTPDTSNEVFAKMHQEHDALREKLGQIHDVFQGTTPDPKQINKLLREFEEALVIHFAHEEADGFFDEVICHAPSMTAEADRLGVEHEQLRQEAAELCQFAASGSPSLPWWRELGSRCRAFSQKLMHHESTENRLLQMACRQEIGEVD